MMSSGFAGTDGRAAFFKYVDGPSVASTRGDQPDDGTQAHKASRRCMTGARLCSSSITHKYVKSDCASIFATSSIRRVLAVDRI
jgi:hypothetical protein